jgi:hypothetical protein
MVSGTAQTVRDQSWMRRSIAKLGLEVRGCVGLSPRRLSAAPTERRPW